MNKAFVVSDIHGCYDQFIKLLEHWDKADELIILGDLIDRGHDSLKVVQHIITLSQNYKVTVLQGNHDQMLGDFIDDPHGHGYLYLQENGGRATLLSFIANEFKLFSATMDDVAYFLKRYRKKELDFLRQGLLYYEFGKVLFTHAGFCSWRDCWEETTDNQYIWIRDHYKHKNNSGYVNVFGHTPTQLINADKSNDVWTSQDKTYIGIDGACAYGGQLNGILINDSGELLERYSVE